MKSSSRWKNWRPPTTPANLWNMWSSMKLASRRSRFLAAVLRTTLRTKWSAGMPWGLPAQQCNQLPEPAQEIPTNPYFKPQNLRTLPDSETRGGAPRPLDAEARQPLAEAVDGIVGQLQVEPLVHVRLEVACLSAGEVAALHVGEGEERPPPHLAVLQVLEEADAGLAS